MGIPLDTSGPTGDISPVRGTKEEQKAKRMKISQGKRAQTMAIKREKQAEEVALAAAQAEVIAEQARTLTDEVQKELQGLLESLREKGITLQHLMNFIFNPKYSQGVVRWDEFLSKEGAVEELLNFLVHTNKMTTDRMYEWAISYIGGRMKDEMHRMTKAGILQTTVAALTGGTKQIEATLNLTSLYNKFKESASTSVRLLTALTTSARSARELSEKRQKAQQTVLHLVYLLFTETKDVFHRL
jgi:hypothetical protein